MPHKPAKLLEDIRLAAERIGAFTGGRSFEDYAQSELIRAAVERQFTILGEAMVRLRTVDLPLLERITNFKKIIGFRNILIHGYEIIEDGTVWYAIHNHLPLLKQQAERLLAEFGNSDAPEA